MVARVLQRLKETVWSPEGVSALRVRTTLDDLLARAPEGDLALVRDGAATVIGLRPSEVVSAAGADAFSVLDGLDAGWWAGFCSYDLGRAVERVPQLASVDVTVPDLAFVRFETRVRLEPNGEVTVEGEPDLERLPARPTPLQLRGWTSSLDPDAWTKAVDRILRHLHDGDCYQVNLTRRLCCEGVADPVSLFRALIRENPAPHAALVRIGDVAVVSASPERFLRIDGRRIESRPIKGTSSDPDALLRSEKDRAENVMIVDLARNDLGRVCEYGSIHVPDLCALESHPGLYHLVSTVTGTLRQDASLGDVVRATFPPASVTGCPKPRVLEIIETLEPVRRGVYCGAVGFIDADRSIADLNVAIRTFTVTGDATYFGVGAGIVADSDPQTEWLETELKARKLLAAAAG
jgi:para-aminobenzoate synthetase component 1